METRFADESSTFWQVAATVLRLLLPRLPPPFVAFDRELPTLDDRASSHKGEKLLAGVRKDASKDREQSYLIARKLSSFSPWVRVFVVVALSLAATAKLLCNRIVG